MQTPDTMVSFPAAEAPSYYCMAEHDPAGSSETASQDNRHLIRQRILTVLIADDSLTERTRLARILQDAGFEVITAGSGNEAVTLAKQHEPDAIFSISSWKTATATKPAATSSATK
ncbi:MAG: response regulator [Thiolinea sp.]